MPKEARKKINARHAISPKTVKLLDTIRSTEEPIPVLPVPAALDDGLVSSEEKGKRAKFDALQQRISESSAPYSKSHSRRLKRKAKEQLAGNDMSELLNTLQPEIEEEDASPADKLRQKRALEKNRTIGKGKKSTLSETQRRKELERERQRIPLVLSNPEFSKNPFEAIRTHARNTLVQHSQESKP
ncbi:hypothetical protein CYLTODRAFT_417627 [Cylindrobasidium torrendii FP15055 ss-10]|uniref:Ribosome biogenesis protein SLX9 n=1 Tax=Cylindrobasidium torrendii FP15055 ss-10 TaxID=1314674 RepID=A0A0D7BRJ4_9AGAR|nr:hypothetical protein CYLTODRAFT_417627 [Cylindrobasidium torrendii FP15055 ss-10]